LIVQPEAYDVVDCCRRYRIKLEAIVQAKPNDVEAVVKGRIEGCRRKGWTWNHKGRHPYYLGPQVDKLIFDLCTPMLVPHDRERPHTSPCFALRRSIAKKRQFQGGFRGMTCRRSPGRSFRQDIRVWPRLRLAPTPAAHACYCRNDGDSSRQSCELRPDHRDYLLTQLHIRSADSTAVKSCAIALAA